MKRFGIILLIVTTAALAGASGARADCPPVGLIDGRAQYTLVVSPPDANDLLSLKLTEGSKELASEELPSVGPKPRCIRMKAFAPGLVSMEFSQGTAGTSQLVERVVLLVFRVGGGKIEAADAIPLSAVEVGTTPPKKHFERTYRIQHKGGVTEVALTDPRTGKVERVRPFEAPR